VAFWLFPLWSWISIRSADGVVTHYGLFQARLIALFHTDKINTLREHRKELKLKVRAQVNRIGPELFKNFNKLKLIAAKGNQEGTASKTASVTDYEPDYYDELEITHAFQSLKELENI